MTVPSVYPVRVDWEDACGGDGWQPAEDCEHAKLQAVVSIGFLMHKNERRLVLAQTLNEASQELNNFIIIPTANVQSIKRLSAPRRTRR